MNEFLCLWSSQTFHIQIDLSLMFDSTYFWSVTSGSGHRVVRSGLKQWVTCPSRCMGNESWRLRIEATITLTSRESHQLDHPLTREPGIQARKRCHMYALVHVYWAPCVLDDHFSLHIQKKKRLMLQCDVWALRVFNFWFLMSQWMRSIKTTIHVQLDHFHKTHKEATVLSSLKIFFLPGKVGREELLVPL